MSRRLSGALFNRSSQFQPVCLVDFQAVRSGAAYRMCLSTQTLANKVNFKRGVLEAKMCHPLLKFRFSTALLNHKDCPIILVGSNLTEQGYVSLEIILVRVTWYMFITIAVMPFRVDGFLSFP